MNEDTFNLSIRKFLKMVGVGSQREIEHAVTAALAAGTISGKDPALPDDAGNGRIEAEGRLRWHHRARSRHSARSDVI